MIQDATQMTIKEITTLYEKIVGEAINYLTFCRDVSLQKKEIEDLEKNVGIFKNFKWQANRDKQEKLSNLFFGCHNYLNAVKNCIESIVLLKENQPERAWDKLMNAEVFYSWASKVNDCLLNEFCLMDYMKKMEELLFPHFKVYSSLGFTTTKGDCSVCSKKIDECEHIEGNIYSGFACFEKNKKVLDIDHSALVENPRDRRCVPIEISENGKMINYFTLKETRDLNEKEKEECAKGHLQAKWAMMNFEELDIN